MRCLTCLINVLVQPSFSPSSPAVGRENPADPHRVVCPDDCYHRALISLEFQKIVRHNLLSKNSVGCEKDFIWGLKKDLYHLGRAPSRRKAFLPAVLRVEKCCCSWTTIQPEPLKFDARAPQFVIFFSFTMEVLESPNGAITDESDNRSTQRGLPHLAPSSRWQTSWAPSSSVGRASCAKQQAASPRDSRWAQMLL